MNINTLTALNARINAHNFSEKDIDSWILSHFSDLKNKTILDLGCGNGKQLFKFHKKIGNGKIIGIDINEEFIRNINQKKKKNIIAKIGKIENFQYLIDEKVDIIICCFAVYYSKNIDETISQMFDILKKDGKILIVGPTMGNINELLGIHDNVPSKINDNTNFITSKVLPLVTNYNPQIKYFQNKVTFPTTESVFKYWKNGLLYNRKIENKIKQRIENHIKQYGNFVVTKNVISLLIERRNIGFFCDNKDNPQFNFTYYKNLLEVISLNNFRFLTHEEFFKGKRKNKIVLLRHDVDGNMENAYKFAKIEYSLNIKAVYFFRVHADYNLFSYQNLNILRKIAAMKHEIGLHYEALDLTKLFSGNMKDNLIREKKILEMILGKSIAGCAAHRDWASFTSNLDCFKNIKPNDLGFLYEAYEIEKYMVYVTEAFNKNGITWRYDLNNLLKKKKAICIMIHPKHWYEEIPFERKL